MNLYHAFSQSRVFAFLMCISAILSVPKGICFGEEPDQLQVEIVEFGGKKHAELAVVGLNAKSSLLARGLSEIARLGIAMGAKLDTFFGIAGVGDLATTCFSPHGRNRSCGERLGKGESIDTVLATSDYVVEGVPTTKSMMTLASVHNVEMPITAAVNAILFEGLSPRKAITSLMQREPKPERIG